MDFDIYKLVDKYKLSCTEQEILQYILDNSDEALNLNVRKIAKMHYTSPTTVIRLAQKLGYKGYTDMAYRINFSLRNAAERFSAFEKSKKAVNIDYALADVSPDQIISFVGIMRKNLGATVYANGIGFSQPVVQYMVKKLLVLGYASILTDSFELYEHNSLNAKMAFFVSRTGETYEVAKAAKMAAESGIDVISFTCDEVNTIAENSFINFKVHDNDKFDDRNINANYFYPNVMALFEYLICRFMESSGD